MTFEEIIQKRCSIRIYDKTPIDAKIVKECLQLASLSPSSSNMQLWQFYHIITPKTLAQFIPACFNQNAVKTAQQLVVFVTRQDLAKQRAKEVLELEIEDIRATSPKEKQEKRIRKLQKYYGKTLPFLYGQLWGLKGLIRLLLIKTMGLFKPIFQEVTESSTRVMVHKSCALAAQTFMLAMTDKGYDTCPLEGYDSRMVRKILKLPKGAEINMIISCGMRSKDTNHGERKRIPFNKVYQNI